MLVLPLHFLLVLSPSVVGHPFMTSLLSSNPIRSCVGRFHCNCDDKHVARSSWSRTRSSKFSIIISHACGASAAAIWRALRLLMCEANFGIVGIYRSRGPPSGNNVVATSR